jgi:hypothetical protein
MPMIWIIFFIGKNMQSVSLTQCGKHKKEAQKQTD